MMLRRLMLFLLLGMGWLVAMPEPPLPVWDAENRAQMIKDGWMAGGILLTYDELPQENDEEEVELTVEEPTPEVLAEEPMEEGNIVGEEFLVSYFANKPEGHLVDPQELLDPKDLKNLETFLDYHSGDSSISMYVYVFGGEQEVPSDVRKEEVVERLYSVGKPAMVIYYYLGTPQRSEIYLSPVITDVVSAAEQRRALDSSVMQAFSSAIPAEQLEAFLVQMSIRIYWMERMTEGTAEETEEIIPSEIGGEGFHPKEGSAKESFVVKWPSWAGLVAGISASLCGGGLLFWSMGMWWRHRVRYHFPEFEVEERLGGEHGAGIGAVISFASTEVAPAQQRNQVPDYTRRP